MSRSPKSLTSSQVTKLTADFQHSRTAAIDIKACKHAGAEPITAAIDARDFQKRSRPKGNAARNGKAVSRPLRKVAKAAKRKRLPELTIDPAAAAAIERETASMAERAATQRKDRLRFRAHCRDVSIRVGTMQPHLPGTLFALSMSVADALGFVSLALVQTRKELLAIEQELEPPQEAHGRFLCELRECLVIAGEVVKRRACAGLSREAESDVLHVPLPGLAGIIGHTRRDLLRHLCIFLHEDCCEWVRAVAEQVGGEAELALRESLVLAEQVCSAEGLGNELDKVEGDAWHPTELQQEATARKVLSLRSDAVG